MSKNTWNVIFMSFNTNYEATKNISNEAIKLGIDIFWDDVKNSPFSESLKFNLLEFNGDSNIGNAKLFSTEKNINGNNKIVEKNTITGFNCHVSKSKNSFEDYFKTIYDMDKKDEKYFIVFLAHSFGSGFFPVVTEETKKLDITKQEYSYLTIQQLATSIENVFKKKKIDCFFALNCQIQSIETNYLLRNNVEYLIGSQQPLFVETIQYKTLFSDMISQSVFLPQQHLCKQGTQIMFQKYLHQCHSIYTNKPLSHSHVAFCLTLTKPKNVEYMLFYLNLSFKAVKTNKINYTYINIAKQFCDDPSRSDLVNILDAQTFFTKLKEIFAYENSPFLSEYMDGILKYMNNTIICHVTSGDSYINTNKKFFTSHFIPNGLGIFLEKTESNSTRLTLKIYKDLDMGINSVFSINIKEFSSIIIEEYLKGLNKLIEITNNSN